MIEDRRKTSTPSSLKDIRSEWNKRAQTPGLASVMSLRWGEEASRKATEVYLSKVFSMLGDISSARVLEIGCGIGRITHALKGKAKLVEAIDISRNMLNRARQLNDGAQLCEANALCLPFTDNTFDLVFECTVLQHIVDEDGFAMSASEIKRVVRSEGKIFLSGEMTECDQAKDRSIHTRIRSVQQYKELLSPFRASSIEDFLCITDNYKLILFSQ
jgi:ubiquinone/menaquinone biosynthesis C-methylase UbiE